MFENQNVKNAKARMMADVNFTIGSEVNLSEVANTNVEESTLLAGDVFEAPSADEFDENVFSQKIGRGTAYGVLVNVVDGPSAGMTRRLYFSSLKKRSVKYSEATKKPVVENGAPVVIGSRCDISNAARQMPTLAGMKELIAGKRIKITDAAGSPVITSRFNSVTGVIDGTRSTHVYDFTEVQ